MTMLLEVEDLKKHYSTPRGTLFAVDGVSFNVQAGETLGLVGESGCGKSTLGKTVCRILQPTAGTIRLKGIDIAQASRSELRRMRRIIQFVFQDPYGSLNPRVPIGRILEEALVVQKLGNAGERRDRVAWLLERVGLRPDSASRLPHEFSGGQRQRIGIARALSVSPELVICDEPVSALDVSIQAQILNLLVDLQKGSALSYLFISHDLSVVRYIADRVMIMYLGRASEIAPHDSIWRRPLHPYTQELIRAVPVPDPTQRHRRPALLQTDVPSALAPPPGCRFHARCPLAIEKCKLEEPQLREVLPDHFVACHLVPDKLVA
jgi:oligopeptide/dipeptide ABC transporter ATP-binding protein